MPSNIVKRNYPLNTWWVAARSEEIGNEPFMRWLLDRPVVMFRSENGEPIALDNRCPHRWAPLSDGKVEGDIISCPYHGAQFGADGKCVKYPSQDKPPAKMGVQSFPIVERGQFIWIWMGDPEKCALADLPPILKLGIKSGWFGVTGDFEFGANYFLLHENVLDLTHFNFVHAESFGIKSWNPSPEYKVDGQRAGFTATLYPEDFPPEERAALGIGFPGTKEMYNEGWFETPAMHYNKSIVRVEPEGAEPVAFNTNIYHLVTPASPTHTYYWWFVETDAPMPDEAKAGFNDFLKIGYLEDKVILESIQDILNKDVRGHDYPEFTLNGDGGGMLARRALKKLLDAEAT